jgi:hypothetical protein
MDNYWIALMVAAAATVQTQSLTGTPKTVGLLLLLPVSEHVRPVPGRVHDRRKHRVDNGAELYRREHCWFLALRTLMPRPSPPRAS